MSTEKKSMMYYHALLELQILCKSAKGENRPVVEPFIDEILALMEKFGDQHYSGSEAAFKGTAIIEAIKRLMQYMPLHPLTGIDDEWIDKTEANGGVFLFQNKRCPSVFKDLKGAYYVDAVIFKRGKDDLFTSPHGVKLHNGGVLTSKQYIKFPFKPKTFYIDVYDLKEETRVKDERQLVKLREYYPEASRLIL